MMATKIHPELRRTIEGLNEGKQIHEIYCEFALTNVPTETIPAVVIRYTDMSLELYHMAAQTVRELVDGEDGLGGDESKLKYSIPKGLVRALG